MPIVGDTGIPGPHPEDQFYDDDLETTVAMAEMYGPLHVPRLAGVSRVRVGMDGAVFGDDDELPF